jgi:alpha-L-arabinofuranosidase
MRLTLCALLMLAGPACSSSRPTQDPAPAGAATATITVQADAPGPNISPTLYGLFFEEINCAGDGGLYAELVRNRSLEDTDKGPQHWTALSPSSALGLDAGWPEGEFNRRSLKIALKAGEGRLGVANGGWWGIAVRDGESYDLSLHARAGDGLSGPLVATLESADGKVHAEAKIDGVGAEWKRFSASLKAKGTDPKARLAIAASRPGTLWLDMVSLFPAKTFKGHGMREDLAKMLLDLKPSFVRFPGGCWVEGNTMAEAQRWKQTIGDPALRRTQYNLWQYMSTNGLGYHEYLQLCEDLGAEPLFVINCGMSHRQNVPMDQMGEFVQDALDAIEYANGPPDSPWGARRAKAGHPAPFNLKYLEIGNENGGPAYNERYALFYDAIKAKYPQMNLIANDWGGKPTSRRVEILDEHYYNNPAFFARNAHKYDGYKRDGHKVYVGEYAVTQGAGKMGNLKAAVGEAAFMTGMERNSDVVVLASYAPLFANVNYKKWSPDLINFDSARVFGTPAYYVQKMFSENRADVVLPAQAEASVTLPPPVLRGKVGLGTWITQAEYKDVKVTSSGGTVFESDFVNGMKSWKPFKGQWAPRDGALQQTSNDGDCRITAGHVSWQDYTLTLKARKLGGAEGFLVMFLVRDDHNWIWWNLGGWGNSKHALEACENGGKSILGSEAPGKIETNRWYDVKIEIQGAKIRCSLDGKVVHDTVYSLAPTKPLHVVAGRAEASGDVILKVVNTADAALPTKVQVRGLSGLQPKATATVLTSPDPMDENSIDEPVKVAPVTRAIENAGPAFTHTFPANSVTVLRLKTR